VARLISIVLLVEAPDTGGIWFVAHALACSESTYKSQLMACGAERRNDLDVGGHWREEALVIFTRTFLEDCLDQVISMEARGTNAPRPKGVAMGRAGHLLPA